MKWFQFLLSFYPIIILNNLVSTGQRMDQKKTLMKENKQKTTNFFYKNNFKRTMRYTGKQEQNKNNQG